MEAALEGFEASIGSGGNPLPIVNARYAPSGDELLAWLAMADAFVEQRS
jgi:hypothetical protein